MSGSQNDHLPQNGFAPAAEAALDERAKRLIGECLDRELTDKCLDAALERKPQPHIPASFAAKVAARAAALPPRRRTVPLPIGRSIAWASMVLLALALFVFAPHATPNITSFSFDAEILTLLELAGLGWLLSRSFGERLTH